MVYWNDLQREEEESQPRQEFNKENLRLKEDDDDGESVSEGILPNF